VDALCIVCVSRTIGPETDKFHARASSDSGPGSEDKQLAVSAFQNSDPAREASFRGDVEFPKADPLKYFQGIIPRSTIDLKTRSLA
jgi:hypothetical protein